MSEEIEVQRVVLEDLFKTNFSIFDNCAEEIKMEQINKITYIEKIAHQLERNLSNIDLLKVFPNEDNIFTMNEGEINQILIDFKREDFLSEPDPVHELVELTEEQVTTIKNVYNTSFNHRKTRIQNDINSCIHAAQRKMGDYHNHMTRASALREELSSIQESDSNPMLESINKVLADPRFEFLRFSGHNVSNDTITFLIKDDIINTHVNQRAGINLRVNLGKLVLRVRFSGGLTILVDKHSDNIISNNYFHPHISHDRTPCLGNMGEMYSECQKNNDVHGMIESIMAVLLNYNDSDPYRPLARFMEVSSQTQPSGHTPVRSTDPRHQYHSCYECEDEFEIEFEPQGVSDYMEAECPNCSYITEYEYQEE